MHTPRHPGSKWVWSEPFDFFNPGEGNTMRKSRNRTAPRNNPSTLKRFPLAAAICLAFASPAFAQDTSPPAEPQEQPTAESRQVTLDTVTVTSQKRAENLQKVPISIQVLGAQQLDELNVSDFDDYARLLPSVSIQSFQPGFNLVYMRGVASGGDGNHSGSLPSVGTYLDEQPITTAQGALDLHIYDIERVEALAGPQGTLYGASSQSGTIRIITNKPDASGFAAGYGIEANAIDNGGSGYVAEAFVNAPISENAAIRLVGWSKHDAGYIDNVRGTRTFPSWDADSGGNGTIDNEALAKNNYNDSDTTGARLALKIDLNENWTVMPTVMAQKQKVNGSFGFDPSVGDLAITHFYPESSDDSWTQAALTVQGRIGNFDLTYAFSHLKRDVDSELDYNDYAFWYDTLAGYGAYFYDNSGALVNPSQYIQGVDGYKRQTHELRIASPQDRRLRFVAGLFMQDAKHDIEQRYAIDNLAASLSVTGWPDTIWLTQQDRRDRDKAVFGEVSYDVTDKLTVTGGARFFNVHNSLKGFFGFSTGYAPSANYGEAACVSDEDYESAPCLVNDKEIKENGSLGRVNATYQIDDDTMVYATWSEGYRPGGINRRATLPPYLSDYLTNYELGWKTSWADNRLVFNGAVFQEDWEDFQFSILGANGLTEIKNANQARIRGLELDFGWAATYNLKLSGGASFYNSELTANYCGFSDADGNPVTECPPGTVTPDGDTVDGPEAPSGARLPVTAKFKGNLTGRYTFEVGGFEAFLQGSAVHEGARETDLRTLEKGILGRLDAYTTLDLSAGIGKDNWSLDFYLRNATDERGELTRFTQCAETICGNPDRVAVPGYTNGQIYTVPNQPRMFGVRFSQKF